MSTAIAQVTSKPRQRTSVVERHFFTAMASTMLVIGLVGFAPSLVQTSERRAPVSPLVAAHGLLFFGWLVICRIFPISAFRYHLLSLPQWPECCANGHGRSW